MYLVLALTNGEGHSEPDFFLTPDKELAENYFHQKVGETLLISDTTHLTQRGNDHWKRYVLFEKEDDCNYSVLLFDKVKTGEVYHINTNYVNEINVYDLVDTDDVIAEENFDLSTNLVNIESETEQIKSTSVTDQITGNVHIFLQIN